MTKLNDNSVNPVDIRQQHNRDGRLIVVCRLRTQAFNFANDKQVSISRVTAITRVADFERIVGLAGETIHVLPLVPPELRDYAIEFAKLGRMKLVEVSDK